MVEQSTVNRWARRMTRPSSRPPGPQHGDVVSPAPGCRAVGLGESEIRSHSAVKVFRPARAPRIPAMIEKGE